MTAGTSGRLRILKVADVPRHVAGGMHGYMLETGAALTARGHAVTYWFAEDLPTPRTPRIFRRFVLPWLVALKVLRSERARAAFDIVEVHEPLAFALAFLKAKTPLRGGPECVVISYGVEERGWEAQRERWRRRGQAPNLRSRLSVPLTRLLPTRLGLRYASGIMVPSTADCRYLVAVRGLPEGKISFVPTGVTPDLFEIRDRTVAPLSLVFVGTWTDRKGTPELVAAWQELSVRYAELSMAIVGTGVDEALVLDSFLPSCRERLRVYRNVDRPQLAGLLAASHIFVLPSWFEGMPLALLEAAASGLPCVVCNVCGNIDFIREAEPLGDGGLLIPPHDAAALVGAVERLIRDPVLRLTLGARARERARRFTWADTADRMEQAYRRAIPRQDPSTSGIDR